MAVELATAYVALVASARGIAGSVSSALAPTSGIASSAGKTAGATLGTGLAAGAATGAGDATKAVKKGFVSPVGGMMKGVFALAAAGAVVGFIKGAVSEGREAQKVGALTESIIKSTGGAANLTAEQVGNYATALSNKTGMDDEAIQAGENLLLTFKNVRDEVGEGNDIFGRATAAAADLSAAGFGDMANTSKQLGKALNDPVKGMAALGRAGVTFSDQQKEQIATLVESGDVLGAQKIILGEVESQVGGAAEASATAGEKMSVAWGNLKESMGTALIPVIDTLMGALQPVVEWLTNNPTVVMALVAALGFLAVAIGVAAIAQWVMNSALFASPITWIVLGIAVLIAALVLLVTHWDTVVKWLKSVWGNIVGWLAGVWGSITGGIKSAWNAVASFFTGLWAKITGGIRGAWNAVLSFFTGLWDNIRSGVTSAWNAIVAWITGIPGRFMAGLAALGQLAGRLGGFVADAAAAIRDRFLEVVEWVAGVPGRILDGLGDLGSMLLGAGKDLLDGLLQGIKDGFEAVKDFVGGIGTWIADHKGPKAYDLALLRPAGGWIMTGLVRGIRREIPALLGTVGAVNDALTLDAAPRWNPPAAGALGAAAGGVLGGRGGGTTNLTFNTTRVTTRDVVRALDVAELHAVGAA